ncbi:hypothetical protein QBC34DRAFT_476700 [Podospora aff. communis PSN243]|uniref:Uncharacterized protein n=1 Tax=Podospora aff. communis PSN243 TaxID=3040156 RepID=A0AAV9G6C7_9PEZI|nr:hypothetical protein QBC34DRAFT_476700 [Podospora aff. communis PSN243]
MLLSLASMTAMVAILICYDAKVFPYVPGDISLNAIIAILSTISKSSLIFSVSTVIGQLKWDWYEREPRGLSDLETFDKASRGPLGAVQLLFGKTISVRSIASIRAVITILALAIDPFVQQVAGTAQLESYVDSDDAWTERQTKPVEYRDSDSSYQEMLNHLNGAVWNDAAAYDRRAKCPSGNCRFESFETVEFCVKKENVTDLAAMKFNCSVGFNRETFNGLLDRWMRYGAEDSETEYCEVLLPAEDRPYLTYPVKLSIRTSNPALPATKSPDTRVHLTIHYPLSIITRSFTRDREPTGASEEFFLLEAGQANQAGYVGRPGLGVPSEVASFIPWFTGNPLRLEWAYLTFCERRRSVSTRNGATTSILTSTRPGFFSRTQFPPIRSDRDTKTSPDWAWYRCWSPDANDASRADFNITPTAMSFCYLDFDDEQWGEDLSSLLEGQRSVEGILSGTSTELLRILDGKGRGKLGFNFRSAPIALHDRVRNRTLGDTMEGIAAALNNLSLTLTQEPPIRGQARLLTTVVAVRWHWLILPLGTEVLGWILLLIAMYQKRGVAGLWKDSLLAVLYHGLDSDDGTLDGQNPRR